ncbi:hypothetical protein EMIT0P201_12257 [Pseudomonas chlororaphis]
MKRQVFFVRDGGLPEPRPMRGDIEWPNCPLPARRRSQPSGLLRPARWIVHLFHGRALRAGSKAGYVSGASLCWPWPRVLSPSATGALQDLMQVGGYRPQFRPHPKAPGFPGASVMLSTVTRYWRPSSA